MSLSNKKKQLPDYARYSGIAFQMAFIILIGIFGGFELDKLINLKFPVFTVLLSIGSVTLAIYIVVKDLLKKD